MIIQMVYLICNKQNIGSHEFQLNENFKVKSIMTFSLKSMSNVHQYIDY